MQRYLSEFTFRANNRERVNGMFDLLVGRCDAPHQGVELRGIGGADPIGLGLRREVH